MPGAKEESCWGLKPETSDVISWQRVFSLHKMREVKLLFYKEGELSVLHDIKILSDNPDNQLVSTHKIHLVIFDGREKRVL